MTPEALRRRMAHGNVYPAERVDASLANFFREGNLGALRELALMWVADRVDEALEHYRAQARYLRPLGDVSVLVAAITAAPGATTVIRRAPGAWRRGPVATCWASTSDPPTACGNPGGEALDDQRRLLAELGGQYHELASADVATALADFAARRTLSQIVLGASRRSRWAQLLQGSVVNDVLRAAGAIDVHVISSDADVTGERA